jgi:hypothetical protein
MYAFVDETGNTGGNLFDADQPVFLTAALITRSDFDKSHRVAFESICERTEGGKLHASELGFGGIEQIAGQTLKLLKAADARFLYRA